MPIPDTRDKETWLRMKSAQEERGHGELCGRKLECGGDCFFPRDHEGPHTCDGDDDGEPGTCPA